MLRAGDVGGTMLAFVGCNAAADRRLEIGVLAHPCLRSVSDMVELDGWISTNLSLRSSTGFCGGMCLVVDLLGIRETYPALRSHQQSSFEDEAELHCTIPWAVLARLYCFLAWDNNRNTGIIVFVVLGFHRLCVPLVRGILPWHSFGNRTETPVVARREIPHRA